MDDASLQEPDPSPSARPRKKKKAAVGSSTTNRTPKDPSGANQTTDGMLCSSLTSCTVTNTFSPTEFDFIYKFDKKLFYNHGGDILAYEFSDFRDALYRHSGVKFDVAVHPMDSDMVQATLLELDAKTFGGPSGVCFEMPWMGWVQRNSHAAQMEQLPPEKQQEMSVFREAKNERLIALQGTIPMKKVLIVLEEEAMNDVFGVKGANGNILKKDWDVVEMAFDYGADVNGFNHESELSFLVTWKAKQNIPRSLNQQESLLSKMGRRMQKRQSPMVNRYDHAMSEMEALEAKLQQMRLEAKQAEIDRQQAMAVTKQVEFKKQMAMAEMRRAEEEKRQQEKRRAEEEKRRAEQEHKRVLQQQFAWSRKSSQMEKTAMEEMQSKVRLAEQEMQAKLEKQYQEQLQAMQAKIRQQQVELEKQAKQEVDQRHSQMNAEFNAQKQAVEEQIQQTLQHAQEIHQQTKHAEDVLDEKQHQAFKKRPDPEVMTVPNIDSNDSVDLEEFHSAAVQSGNHALALVANVEKKNTANKKPKKAPDDDECYVHVDPVGNQTEPRDEVAVSREPDEIVARSPLGEDIKLSQIDEMAEWVAQFRGTTKEQEIQHATDLGLSAQEFVDYVFHEYEKHESA